MLSIIMPIYNEEKYICKCINSILEQDFSQEDMELLLVDGMSSDRTRDLIQPYLRQYPWIHLLDNPQRIAPCAMNVGIKAAQGDVIMRLDAHAEFPSNYFSRLTKALDDLHADNVGGVCVTLPTSETIVPKAIASVLSSKFGMGNSSFRVGTNRVREVDTVPFGCWHRELFERIGGFDEELVRNQDDEFNGRTIKNGGRIFLLPDVEIQYFARDKISKVSQMFFQYGLFKPLVNKKLGSPATVRQFFPPILVLGLTVGLLVTLAFPILFPLYFMVIALYLCLAFYFSIRSSRNIVQIAVQMYVYFVVHISYGLGYLLGLWKLVTNQPFVAKINR